MNALRELGHPLVRDLAWAVFSEDLILARAAGSPVGAPRACALARLTPARLAWLRALDRSPRPLLDHVGARVGQRLGLYFESLWHFFLQADPAAELLAHNLPVRDAGRTVGEFDCLYRCRDSGAIVHLELAVKFYLYTGPGSGATGDDRADWLGPGRRDRLDHKLAHMAAHQTRLAAHPAARRLLADRGLLPDRVEVAIKGRLFRRRDQPYLPPRGFNPARALLEWDDTDGLEDLAGGDSATRYHVILPRQHWLAPLAPVPDSSAAQTTGPLYTDAVALREKVNACLATRNVPVLVAALDKDRYELRRFFIAPRAWPA